VAVNNLRILLLNYEFPPLGGGAATASAQIARHMTRAGARVVVLTSHMRGLPRVEKQQGYIVKRVPALRRHKDRGSFLHMGAYIVSVLLPALFTIRKFRPQIMHIYFGIPTGIAALLLHKLTGIPYLLSLRGDDVPGGDGGATAFMHKLFKPLTKSIWRNSSRLLVNGEGLKDRVLSTLPEIDVCVVPNGVDTEMFHPINRVRSSRTVRVLFVGRLHAQKCIDSIFYALKKVKQELPDSVIAFDLIGSGPDEARLKELCNKLELEDIVHFVPWVDRAEIVGYYQNSDIFVLPSLYEGMPNVVAEAMACGNLVIASDIKGIRELIEDKITGRLVTAGNAEAIATAMLEVLTDQQQFANLKSEARKFIETRGWHRTANTYMELSYQILAQWKRRCPAR
jgi:glycosyltransferase involved in cell wall biosynthesis